ncbi:E3 SUMO-protein ligase KIAA1586 isoform X2 [Calliopsis andreniformis]|uniref:E3 SUMO-protein ligase KIAA1586 isoform X2 n=2 Tax=Calliopsis andreniformis TaxID=337506 RepID=UPI003FCE57EF
MMRLQPPQIINYSFMMAFWLIQAPLYSLKDLMMRLQLPQTTIIHDGILTDPGTSIPIKRPYDEITTITDSKLFVHDGILADPGPSIIERPHDETTITTNNKSSSDSTVSKRNSKKHAFCNAWLADPILGPWVKKFDKDPYKAICIVCDKVLTAGKSELMKHSRTQVHNMNMSKIKAEKGELQPLLAFTKTDIKKAEIKFVLEIVEHNKSFHSYKDFPDATQLETPESPILENMTLKRTKIRAIIKNILNECIVMKMRKIFQNKIFSVLIHENTDVSDMKSVCILAQYMHEGESQTYLLDFLRMKDIKADNLYKSLMHALEVHNLCVKNLVSICVDNTKVMNGKHNSVVSRLLTDNKEIIVFSCICHSMYLVANEACEHIPNHINLLFLHISSYRSRNLKRQVILQEMQDLMKTTKQKMLQPCATKWLAISECVHRILNQWVVLFNLFAETSSEEKCSIAEEIVTHFNSAYTKAYLEFLEYILTLFMRLNTRFQSSKISIHRLIPECVRFLRILGANFLKGDILEVENVHEIDALDENNVLPLESIVIGSRAQEIINEIRNTSNAVEHDKIKDFYNNCKKFYQAAFVEAVKRFPFNNQILRSLDILSPRNALDLSKHGDRLDHVLHKFQSRFDSKVIQDEWLLLPSFFLPDEKERLIELNISDFWNEVNKITDLNKNDSEYPVFGNITKLARFCLSLPYSNADVETVFSMINDIKTLERNRLTPDMIAALCRVKLDIERSKKQCLNYEITQEMLSLFNANMYKNTQTDNSSGILVPHKIESSEYDIDIGE